MIATVAWAHAARRRWMMREGIVEDRLADAAREGHARFLLHQRLVRCASQVECTETELDTLLQSLQIAFSVFGEEVEVDLGYIPRVFGAQLDGSCGVPDVHLEHAPEERFGRRRELAEPIVEAVESAQWAMVRSPAARSRVLMNSQPSRITKDMKVRVGAACYRRPVEEVERRACITVRSVTLEPLLIAGVGSVAFPSATSKGSSSVLPRNRRLNGDARLVVVAQVLPLENTRVSIPIAIGTA